MNSESADVLRARWLGRVGYGEALALQHALFASDAQHLLLLEHPHVFTMGIREKPEHVLTNPAELGAELVHVHRGGDVTYHGPGQLVGYPVLSVAGKGGLTDTVQYVAAVEQLIIDVLLDLGVPGCGRMYGQPGVWLGLGTDNERKIAAVGVRLTRGRSMHGFALNVDTDLSWFDHIIPCGIRDKAVTSLRAEGFDLSMRDVVNAIFMRASQLIGSARGSTAGSVQVERQDVAWKVVSSDLSAFSQGGGPGSPTNEPGPSPTAQPVRLMRRLSQAGVDSTNALPMHVRKPEWLKVRANYGNDYQVLKKTVRDGGLTTVCEEAGCPNIFDCWNDGTATFMINGERCTRACGFCLVDTRKPDVLDPTEPDRVADAVARMKLDHAVITTVARDDLPDGGAGAFASTINAIHQRCPGTAVEVLISDCKGDSDSLTTIFNAGPEILNHNLETVARLQRAVRPSAGYARSLAVLSRAKAAGLVTKSGIMVGLGETRDEIVGALADLRAVGVDIVTIGQYLRPTSNHLPMDRWWTPEEFAELKPIGTAMGFAHVEASPLTRSSFHAKRGAAAAGVASLQKT